MKVARARDVDVHFVEHGDGVPVIVLHGAGVDHREAEACFEPALRRHGRLRRIYPDLPGFGRTPSPPSVASGDDEVAVLMSFVSQLVGDEPVLLVGHSAGAYLAAGLADRLGRERVLGLALVCPLLSPTGPVPDHDPVIASEHGDADFREYFVLQTSEMLARYDQVVRPAAALVDEDAMRRIGDRWTVSQSGAPGYEGPTLVVAGRRDSIVGYEAALGLIHHYPRTTVAVLEQAGHALPHEQPRLLDALILEWLGRSLTPPP